MRRAIALVVACGLVAPAAAGPRKVLVLPLDGSADSETRTKVSASVQRLARILEGQVSTGDATFSETAAAVGCDPEVLACAEEVRNTLGVDELVYGSVSTQTITVQGATQTQLVIVVRRTNKTGPAREITTTLAAQDPAERAEPAILPLFNATAPDDARIAPPVEPVPVDEPVVIAPPARSTRERNIGIAAVAGGGTMLLIGLAMWSSASGVQDDIDRAETDSVNDFMRLQDLEDTASSRAWAGNVLVLAGLALGGYGGWLLYKDHQGKQVMVTPTPLEGGAAITLTIGGGL